MSDEQSLDSAEISRRIVIGMGLVYDLYNELNGLLRMIRERLRSPDLEIDLLMRKLFRMPVPVGGSRTPADKSLPLDWGFLGELGVARSEDEDAGDEDEEDEVSEAKSESKGRPVSPGSLFLGIRAILYDPEKAKTSHFVPTIVAAILANMKRAPAGKHGGVKKPTDKFLIERRRLLKLLKNLDPTVSNGETITCRIPKFVLSATATNVVSRPLAEFDSEEAVNAFIEKIVAMAESAES